MDIKINDDVTIAGKVVRVSKNYVEIKLKHGDPFWVDMDDIKTIRPNDGRQAHGKK